MNTDEEKILNADYKCYDDENFRNAVIQALKDYDKIKEREEKDKKKAAWEETNRKLGVKEGKANILPYLKLILRPKHYLYENSDYISAISVILQIIYIFFEKFLILVSICAICYAPLQFVVSFLPILTWYNDIVLVLFAFDFFMASRFFQLFRVYIINIHDENKLYNIFGAWMSCISVVSTIVPILFFK